MLARFLELAIEWAPRSREVATTEIGCEDCRMDRTIDVGVWLRVLSVGPCTVSVLPERSKRGTSTGHLSPARSLSAAVASPSLLLDSVMGNRD